MHETNHEAGGPARLRTHVWLLSGLWTAVVGMALTWEYVDAGNHASEIAHSTTGYGGVWLLGLCGIVAATRHLRRQIARGEEAERKLRQTQIRARETAAKLPGVVYQFLWHTDRTYRFPYVSDGVTEMLGLSPEEVYCDPTVLFPGVLHQEDLDSIMESIVEAAEDMTTWSREMRTQSGRGEIKWIRATSRPRSMPDGSILFDGVFLDVTDRKEAEVRLQQAHDALERRVVARTAELQRANQELQKEIADHKQAEWWLLQSEERFRSYFELGLVGMAVISPQGEWEEVNGRLCKILGYTEVELSERKWAELTHPEDVEADRAQFDRILAGVTNGYAMDRRFLCRN